MSIDISDRRIQQLGGLLLILSGIAVALLRNDPSAALIGTLITSGIWLLTGRLPVKEK